MAYYKVEGGHPLSGSIRTTSGKNAPIALLCGALMVRGKTTFTQVAHIEELERLLELFESIEVKISWEDHNTLVVDATDINIAGIDQEACGRMRISLLLMGALAAREKQFTLYKSAGCKLGKRTIRPHMLALQKLGIAVESTEETYEVDATKLTGGIIIMDESGDTATENAILGAVLASGETTIKFASANYMVQDLCHFLVDAGAKIEGIGTTTLKITGVEQLNDITYAAMPDPVDAMAWISLAVTTKSPLVIERCPLDFLELEMEKMRLMGQQFTLTNERMSTNGYFRLADIEVVPSELTALPDKLSCRPFPGLNIDALPLFLPMLTQAKGQTLVHDWVYENRAIYYTELTKLGAKVILMDPHRVLVQGPEELVGNEVVAPYAIRPAMAVLIAMIAAKGTSTLRNIYPIERAYEGIVERLTAVGAKIERLEE
ncbi:MAG: UDP-N-acetylglucosamine 1-carboxyvinyltransferase [Candidatus Magasanikbacteria bacterium]|jgi:UDP-N-acetylglucosamine 1-carboxyvinyltransferase|nr:UDP-N-acetylglucosamine 1-carboxyvinyltransferase [Candidatus Magasanikbacteria bacterium]